MSNAPTPPYRSSLADHPDVRDIIPAFVARLPAHVRMLRELIAAGDREGLQLRAHKLRGAGESFGFEPITRHAAAIEELLLAGGTVENATPAVIELIQFMQKVEGF